MAMSQSLKLLSGVRVAADPPILTMNKRQLAHKRAYSKRAYDSMSSDEKSRYIARTRKTQIIRKEETKHALSEWKHNGCRVCGERTECCLSAHHVSQRDKKYAITQMFVLGYSKHLVLAELSKCVCVCENCHRKIHAGLIPCPPL